MGWPHAQTTHCRTPRQPSAKTTNPTCREGCVGGRQHGGHQVGVAQLLGGAGSLHAGCDWGAVRVRSGSRWARNGSGWAGRASNLRKAVQTAQLAASAAVCRGQGQTGQETGPVCPLVRQGKRWLRQLVRHNRAGHRYRATEHSRWRRPPGWRGRGWRTPPPQQSGTARG